MPTNSAQGVIREKRGLLAYVALLIGVVLVYLWIRAYGDTLQAPAPSSPLDAVGLPQVHVNDFLHVLLALALVIACARTLGALFRFVHQPPVVGEMIAGILLGPSLLGHVAPHFAAYLLPQSIAPLLNVISQMGVILYMFLVGLELDVSAVRERAHSTIAISHASIVVPFLLGAGLALPLYAHLSNSSVSFTAFSLFLGASMSVTAFPVLARILTDRRIHKTKMGALTLACAAIDDVTAWCLLAFVVSVTQSRAGSALPTLLMAVGYISIMLFVIRPLVVRLTRWVDGKGRPTQGVLAVVLLAILFSSLATESIGIHSIFGAFVLGAIIPHGSALARDLASKLEDFVVVFLLPAFFAFTGLRTQIGLVSGTRDWMFCLLIILIASLGKFGGSAVAAKLSGLKWRDASALGVLMNTRGLMELIVLNIGLELHVISPTLFAMLVIMALVTTLITTPVLHFILPRRRLEDEAKAIDEESKVASAVNGRTGTLIPVSSPNGVSALIELALRLTPADAPPPRVLALNRGTLSGTGPKLRETDPSPSRSPILAAALDAAWSRGAVITPNPVWTTDAASEIIEAVETSQVRWLLLESRRSILGRYPKRSIVNRVMERAASLPVNVAVLLQSSVGIEGPVTCVVDGARDGRSAVELALQLSKACTEKVRLLVFAPSDWLNQFGSQVDIQIIQVPSSEDLAKRVPRGLLVIAKDVADKSQITFEGLTDGRGLLVIQGASNGASTSASYALDLQTVTVST
jgi:Kef-type K+ transport system membrane component KefB